MVHGKTPFQLLYVSQIAGGFDFGIVKELVVVSRQRNPERGITGALLFDGERFCQLLEGAESDVRSLMDSIGRDPRHTDVRLLFAGQSLAGRSMHRWASGYCEPSALDVFEGVAGLRGRPALDAFMALLKSADVD